MLENIRFMHNRIHFELIILGTVMFIVAGENLTTYEFGNAPQSNQTELFWTTINIVAMCIWANSCLTLTLRVTKGLKTVTNPIENAQTKTKGE